MTYLVAVRALCDFTAKHGDLDLRFTPAPSAKEGMAGHALVSSRRGENYQTEVSLAGDYKTLRVRGRADGYDRVLNQLEEVKTFRGDLHAMPDNQRALHWAQLKIYGWLLCQENGLDEINLTLVYFDIASLQETPLTESFTAAALKAYFEQQCERFLVWAESESAHRSARNAGLDTLTFPHTAFRSGQRELAEAIYKTTLAGKCLLAQAPTGIGKTVGTLFPILKAAPKQRLDKLFFLAAKTPGRKLAIDALDLITTRVAPAGSRFPLRVLELVARDKSCEHPDKACHGDSCPLAKGFYDRLPQARSAAVGAASSGSTLNKAALREIALTHQVCPYYLSQELAIWSDVVVGDYNYYFDSSALLYNLTVSRQWRVSVLVDEAHNMIERARSMYSARLDQAQLQAVHATAPKAIRPALDRLNRAFHELHQTQLDAYEVREDIPTSFFKALQQAITVMTDFMLANPTGMDGQMQAFYFEALHFSRLADSFGPHSYFDLTLNDAQTEGGLLPGTHASAALRIRNVVPAPFLTPRIGAANSIVLFSATLSPPDFYREMLGFPPTIAWIDVKSPFTKEQLDVVALTNLSTRFQHRDQSLRPIAELIANQYEKAPGNYLAFLSSYDYLDKLFQLFRARFPHITVWEQKRQMDEAGRDQFVAQFTATSTGVGFAVLGGAFAEGIDLPGRRLIGAFIATLGLPQVNPVNEEIKKRVATYFADGEGSRESDGQRGYRYTYLYPGLQKVVQAAGRVIRTQGDEGVIYLMDDRFTRPEVLQWMPGWWKVRQLSTTKLLHASVISRGGLAQPPSLL